MKVGVLIPTFNRKQFLSLALESVLDQLHRELEIIVIDNGSTDGTAELMAGINDPRVRYVVNDQNLGMAGSINKGIALFSNEAEWCTILGDDDILDKDCIMNLVKAVRVAEAKSVVHSHRTFIDAHGGIIREAQPSPREESALDYLDMRSRARRETYLTGVLFNRTMFRRIGGYPLFSTGVGSDDAFIFALSLQDRLVFEQNANSFIRIHNEAESKARTDSIKKLHTVSEFYEYCRRIADKNASYTPEQHRSFVRILERYRRNLNSYWWRSAIHAALDLHDENASVELALLRSYVNDNRRVFSLRIRLNVFIENTFKINPESCKIYRVAGIMIDYLIFLLRNRLP